MDDCQFFDAYKTDRKSVVSTVLIDSENIDGPPIVTCIQFIKLNISFVMNLSNITSQCQKSRQLSGTEPLSVKPMYTNLTIEGRLEIDPHQTGSQKERMQTNTWHRSVLLCVINTKKHLCRKRARKTRDEGCKQPVSTTMPA